MVIVLQRHVSTREKESVVCNTLLPGVAPVVPLGALNNAHLHRSTGGKEGVLTQPSGSQQTTLPR